MHKNDHITLPSQMRNKHIILCAMSPLTNRKGGLPNVIPIPMTAPAVMEKRQISARKVAAQNAPRLRPHTRRRGRRPVSESCTT